MAHTMVPRIQPKRVNQSREQVTAMMHQKQRVLQFFRAIYHQKEIITVLRAVENISENHFQC